MTNEEAKAKLEAYIMCESKKSHFDCGDRCDDSCPLLYEMGTVGEHNEAINIAIKALEKTAEKPIKHFGAIECPNCGRLLMLEEQTYGWCRGCKEYDTEKHCCHRYSSFIRESLQDNINAVLEDIKAELRKAISDFAMDNGDTAYGLRIALYIIDNHISGKEQ